MPNLRKKQGRGVNYSTAHVFKLLELAGNSLPLGIDEWDLIATTFNLYFGAASSRSGDDLKNKFKSLKNSKKPTGDPECPPEIVRA